MIEVAKVCFDAFTRVEAIESYVAMIPSSACVSGNEVVIMVDGFIGKQCLPIDVRPLMQRWLMEQFKAGDRVVAVNADCSYACKPPNAENPVFRLPDGPLRRDVVYYVEEVEPLIGAGQGLYLTGIRAYWENLEISFHYSRFRKVDSLKGHVPVAEEQTLLKPKPMPGPERVKTKRAPTSPLVKC